MWIVLTLNSSLAKWLKVLHKILSLAVLGRKSFGKNWVNYRDAELWAVMEFNSVKLQFFSIRGLLSGDYLKTDFHAASVNVYLVGPFDSMIPVHIPDYFYSLLQCLTFDLTWLFFFLSTSPEINWLAWTGSADYGWINGKSWLII